MTTARSIAAAQTIPRRGAVDANIEQHVRLARAASREQAQVLVFPELSLTGYELDLAGDLAFSEGDPRLGPLLDVASSCAMTLIVGAPVRIGSRLHIGAFIVSRDRTIEVYTKHHLGAFAPDAGAGGPVPPAEETVFRPGNRNPLVRVGGETAAVAVCADASRPSHPERAARRGARIYLASMFVIPTELERELENLGRYATRYAMNVVLANYGGPSGGLPAAGGSAIWSTTGEMLVQLEATGAGVAVATEGPAGWRARTIVLEDP